MKKTLERLSAKHPYYCDAENYYCSDCATEWRNMTEFLDEYEDANLQLNLIFRFDVDADYYDNRDEKSKQEYYARVFIMHQRKGIFVPHLIRSVSEEEAQRFEKFLKRSWEEMKKIWKPLSLTK